MATDNTPPKVGLIAKIGILSIAILLAIRLGLVSYFHSISDDERQLKYVEMAQSRGLQDLRNEEAKRLANVQASMDTLAAKGRVEPGIEPKPASPESAKDTLTGWMQMPKAVESAAPAPSAPTPATSANVAEADAGATVAEAGAAALDAAVPAPSASAQKPQPAPSGSTNAPHPKGAASGHP